MSASSIDKLSYEQIKSYRKGIHIKYEDIALSCLEDALILIEECKLPSKEIEEKHFGVIAFDRIEIPLSEPETLEERYIKIVIECLKVINNTIHEQIYNFGVTVLEAFILIMIHTNEHSTATGLSASLSMKRKDIVNIIGDLMDRGYIRNDLHYYNNPKSTLTLRGVHQYGNGMNLTEEGIFSVKAVRSILIDDDKPIINIIAIELVESVNTLLESKFSANCVSTGFEQKFIDSIDFSSPIDEGKTQEIAPIIEKLAALRHIYMFYGH